MKRFLSTLLTVSLLISVSGCGLFGSRSQEVKPPENPFSFDLPTPTDETSLAYYTNNDTLDTLYASTPYYIGAQANPLPGFAQYDVLKKKKIDEAIQLTKELFDASVKLKTDMEPFKSAYLEFTGTAMKSEKKLGKFAYESGGKMAENVMKEEALIANIESIDTSSVANLQTKSMFEYQKTTLALSLADAVMQDYSYVLSSSAIVARLFENSADPLKTALRDFEQQMEKISDVNNALNDIKNKSITLAAALKQISTGDYYLSQAAMAFVKEKLPAIKEQMNSITPSETFSAEDIAMMKEYAAMFENFSATVEQQIQSLDTKQLISFSDIQKIAGKENLPFLPTAYAAGDLLTTSYDTMAKSAPDTSSILSGLKNAASTVVSVTWQGAKNSFQATQTAVGVTLDTASAATKSGFDVIQGVINGNTTSEIAGEIKGNFIKVKDNFQKGTSGSEVLDEAGKQLEGAEDFIKDQLEASVGKGWTSWAVGGLAKMTVGMFTGFGKGIYKLANKQSTVGTLIEGGLDVGLSLIGGSKTIFQGASAGGKEAGKAFAAKMFTYLKTMGNKLEQGQIKAITAEILKKTKLSSKEVLSLISNSLEMEGKQAVATQLQIVNSEINKRFAQLVKDGLKGILKNAKGSAETVAQNYKDFVKKSFESSLKGYKDALIQVLGNGYEDYIDNLLTGKLDDLIKSAIKNYMDATLFDGEYSKKFPIEGAKSLELKLIVENGTVTGGAEYTYANEGWSATLKLNVEGTIGEKGVIENATWTGSVSGGGPSSSFNLFGLGEDKKCTDHIEATGGGKITGSITEDKKKLKATLTGNVTANGTFWCEPIKDVNNKPIEDPFSFELDKASVQEGQ